MGDAKIIPDEIKAFLERNDWDALGKYLVSNHERYRENIIIPRTFGPPMIKSNEEKMIEAAVESCPFKAIMSCVIGMAILI